MRNFVVIGSSLFDDRAACPSQRFFKPRYEPKRNLQEKRQENGCDVQRPISHQTSRAGTKG
jgi:hypothetical protein